MLEVLTNKSLFSKLKAKVHSKESIYRLIMCFSFILIDEHELPGLSNLTVSVAEMGDTRAQYILNMKQLASAITEA